MMWLVALLLLLNIVLALRIWWMDSVVQPTLPRPAGHLSADILREASILVKKLCADSETACAPWMELLAKLQTAFNAELSQMSYYARSAATALEQAHQSLVLLSGSPTV